MVIKQNIPSRRGYYEWLIQRITAVTTAAYGLFLMFFIIHAHPLTHQDWVNLFNHRFMKIITLIILISLLWHAWIGLWTVFTDYIKSNAVRLVVEIITLTVMIGYLAWGVDILWGTMI